MSPTVPLFQRSYYNRSNSECLRTLKNEARALFRRMILSRVPRVTLLLGNFAIVLKGGRAHRDAVQGVLVERILLPGAAVVSAVGSQRKKDHQRCQFSRESGDSSLPWPMSGTGCTPDHHNQNLAQRRCLLFDERRLLSSTKLIGR
jgi:hypothetical protein